MQIECEHNPDLLIHEIGDPNFSIDEFYTNQFRVVITDCEDETMITIETSPPYDAKEIAEALLKLLNQKYELISQGENAN